VCRPPQAALPVTTTAGADAALFIFRLVGSGDRTCSSQAVVAAGCRAVMAALLRLWAAQVTAVRGTRAAQHSHMLLGATAVCA